MSERLVTVFAGPLWEATVLQGRMEQDGVPAFLPDETIKVIDPFITGANAFDVALRVPANFEEQAMEIATDWVEASKATDAEPSPHDELRHLSRRARWASIWVVTAPYALILACRYLVLCRRYGLRPRDYSYTVAAVLLSVAALVLFVAHASTL